MKGYCFVKLQLFDLNMFPLLCWNRLHCNSTDFLINQSLTFIEHLLIPRSWFGLKLYSIQRVCHFQNFPSTGRISGWVTGFQGCLNSSGTTYNSEHKSRPSDLYSRSLSLILPCRHQGAHWGQQYLLWRRTMVSICPQSTPAPVWLPQYSAACGCVLSLCLGSFVIWVTWCKDNAFLERGGLVGHHGRYRFPQTLIGLQLSSKPWAFCIERGCFRTMWQTDARSSNANDHRQFLWRMCQLEQTSVQLTQPRGQHSLLD